MVGGPWGDDYLNLSTRDSIEGLAEEFAEHMMIDRSSFYLTLRSIRIDKDPSDVRSLEEVSIAPSDS